MTLPSFATALVAKLGTSAMVTTVAPERLGAAG